MKLILLLIAGFLVSTTFSKASKPIHTTFDFVAVDAYTEKDTEGVTISIHTKEGKLLLEGKTKSNGRYSPELDLEAGEYDVRVRDEQDRYVGYSYFFSVSKKFSFHSMEIALFPSKRILDEWTAAEDLKYGLPATGTLAPDLNNDSLFYGCSMDELGDASFPDGIPAMNKFIVHTVRYPQVSIEAGEQGRVFVKFIVEPDGKITHVEIERGVSPLLDGEALRVVRSMPEWLPGTCNESQLRTMARLPLAFSLN